MGAAKDITSVRASIHPLRYVLFGLAVICSLLSIYVLLDFQSSTEAKLSGELVLGKVDTAVYPENESPIISFFFEYVGVLCYGLSLLFAYVGYFAFLKKFSIWMVDFYKLSLRVLGFNLLVIGLSAFFSRFSSLKETGAGGLLGDMVNLACDWALPPIISLVLFLFITYFGVCLFAGLSSFFLFDWIGEHLFGFIYGKKKEETKPAEAPQETALQYDIEPNSAIDPKTNKPRHKIVVDSKGNEIVGGVDFDEHGNVIDQAGNIITGSGEPPAIKKVKHERQVISPERSFKVSRLSPKSNNAAGAAGASAAATGAEDAKAQDQIKLHPELQAAIDAANQAQAQADQVAQSQATQAQSEQATTQGQATNPETEAKTQGLEPNSNGVDAANAPGAFSAHEPEMDVSTQLGNAYGESEGALGAANVMGSAATSASAALSALAQGLSQNPGQEQSLGQAQMTSGMHPALNNAEMGFYHNAQSGHFGANGEAVAQDNDMMPAYMPGQAQGQGEAQRYDQDQSQGHGQFAQSTLASAPASSPALAQGSAAMEHLDAQAQAEAIENGQGTGTNSFNDYLQATSQFGQQSLDNLGVPRADTPNLANDGTGAYGAQPLFNGQQLEPMHPEQGFAQAKVQGVAQPEQAYNYSDFESRMRGQLPPEMQSQQPQQPLQSQLSSAQSKLTTAAQAQAQVNQPVEQSIQGVHGAQVEGAQPEAALGGKESAEVDNFASGDYVAPDYSEMMAHAVAGNAHESNVLGAGTVAQAIAQAQARAQAEEDQVQALQQQETAAAAEGIDPYAEIENQPGPSTIVTNSLMPSDFKTTSPETRTLISHSEPSSAHYAQDGAATGNAHGLKVNGAHGSAMDAAQSLTGSSVGLSAGTAVEATGTAMDATSTAVGAIAGGVLAADALAGAAGAVGAAGTVGAAGVAGAAGASAVGAVGKVVDTATDTAASAVTGMASSLVDGAKAAVSAVMDGHSAQSAPADAENDEDRDSIYITPGVKNKKRKSLSAQAKAKSEDNQNQDKAQSLDKSNANVNAKDKSETVEQDQADDDGGVHTIIQKVDPEVFAAQQAAAKAAQEKAKQAAREAEAKAKAEEELKQAEEKARQEAERKSQAEAEAKAKAEADAEAKAKADAEAQAKAEAEAKAAAEKEEEPLYMGTYADKLNKRKHKKVKFEENAEKDSGDATPSVDTVVTRSANTLTPAPVTSVVPDNPFAALNAAREKAEAERKAKEESEAKAKAEAEAKAKAKAEAERKAKEEAEAQAKAEAEAKAKAEAAEYEDDEDDADSPYITPGIRNKKRKKKKVVAEAVTEEPAKEPATIIQYGPAPTPAPITSDIPADLSLESAEKKEAAAHADKSTGTGAASTDAGAKQDGNEQIASQANADTPSLSSAAEAESAQNLQSESAQAVDSHALNQASHDSAQQGDAAQDVQAHEAHETRDAHEASEDEWDKLPKAPQHDRLAEEYQQLVATHDSASGSISTLVSHAQAQESGTGTGGAVFGGAGGDEASASDSENAQGPASIITRSEPGQGNDKGPVTLITTSDAGANKEHVDHFTSSFDPYNPAYKEAIKAPTSELKTTEASEIAAPTVALMETEEGVSTVSSDEVAQAVAAARRSSVIDFTHVNESASDARVAQAQVQTETENQGLIQAGTHEIESSLDSTSVHEPENNEPTTIISRGESHAHENGAYASRGEPKLGESTLVNTAIYRAPEPKLNLDDDDSFYKYALTEENDWEARQGAAVAHSESEFAPHSADSQKARLGGLGAMGSASGAHGASSSGSGASSIEVNLFDDEHAYDFGDGHQAKGDFLNEQSPAIAPAHKKPIRTNNFSFTDMAREEEERQRQFELEHPELVRQRQEEQAAREAQEQAEREAQARAAKLAEIEAQVKAQAEAKAQQSHPADQGQAQGLGDSAKKENIISFANFSKDESNKSGSYEVDKLTSAFIPMDEDIVSGNTHEDTSMLNESKLDYEDNHVEPSRTARAQDESVNSNASANSNTSGASATSPASQGVGQGTAANGTMPGQTPQSMMGQAPQSGINGMQYMQMPNGQYVPVMPQQGMSMYQPMGMNGMQYMQMPNGQYMPIMNNSMLYQQQMLQAQAMQLAQQQAQAAQAAYAAQIAAQQQQQQAQAQVQAQQQQLSQTAQAAQAQVNANANSGANANTNAGVGAGIGVSAGTEGAKSLNQPGNMGGDAGLTGAGSAGAWNLAGEGLDAHTMGEHGVRANGLPTAGNAFGGAHNSSSSNLPSYMAGVSQGASFNQPRSLSLCSVPRHHYDEWRPSLNLLAVSHDRVEISEEDLMKTSERINEVLHSYGVKASVADYLTGPVITRFDLDLAPGVKSSAISSIEKELCRNLLVPNVRVVPIIEGSSYVGLEVPNAKRQFITLGDMVASRDFQETKAALPMMLGASVVGKPVIKDLAETPHLLVAGTTGSGKSAGLNTMLISLLLKRSPAELRLILVDPKQLEFSIYKDLPHLITPVITDVAEKTAIALSWCVDEMERRFKLMSLLGVRKLSEYNDLVKSEKAKGSSIPDPLWTAEMGPQPQALEPLPWIVVVVEEFADLMAQSSRKKDKDKTPEGYIARLTAKSRAAGIHLVLVTQTPRSEVVNGMIKANIPSRIAFTVQNRLDSNIVLDEKGAECLLGNGDMLYKFSGSSTATRAHGSFTSNDDVKAVVSAWREHAGAPEYLEDVITVPVDEEAEIETDAESAEQKLDVKFDQAAEIAREYLDRRNKPPSITDLQNDLGVGFPRAKKIYKQLIKEGILED